MVFYRKIAYMGRTKTFVREEVLDLAIQLFWEKGFSETSLADLEKATGVNKSGLYSEFKDKEDIFNECVRRYSATHPAYLILDTPPYGWNNIEKFISSNLTCQGKKGCFLSNSLREFAIIPQKSRGLVEESSLSVAELIKKNLKAAGVKKNVTPLASMIATFTCGLSLKLNALKPSDLAAEIESFFKMIKSTAE
jgi:AcrR family transcriptional regulator